MKVVRAEMHFTAEQVGWCIIGFGVRNGVCSVVGRLAVRSLGATAHIHVVTAIGIAAGNGHCLDSSLCHVLDLSSVDLVPLARRLSSRSFIRR